LLDIIKTSLGFKAITNLTHSCGYKRGVFPWLSCSEENYGKPYLPCYLLPLGDYKDVDSGMGAVAQIIMHGITNTNPSLPTY
jgi:methenyltetrahydromethanopterin cyclohydrolase